MRKLAGGSPGKRSGISRAEPKRHYTTHFVKEEHRDSHFQRCLAWTSYIVLVTTSWFAFKAPAATIIVNAIADPIHASSAAIEQKIDEVVSRPSNPWSLRGVK